MYRKVTESDPTTSITFSISSTKPLGWDNCKSINRYKGIHNSSMYLLSYGRPLLLSFPKDIKDFLNEEGETIVKINIYNNSKNTTFKLKTLRNIDRKSINYLRSKEIGLNIN